MLSRNLVRLSCLLLAVGAFGLTAEEPKPAAAPAPQAAPPASKPFSMDRYTWTATPELSGLIRRIVVRNDYGDLRARFGGDGLVSLHAVIQRLGSDPDVGVNVERHDETLTITVVSPPGRVSVEQARLESTAVDRVDLVVYVPALAALDAESLRGIVEARGLKSDVRAVTLDGDISVNTTGLVEARSRGGAVIVGMGKQGSGPAWVESRTGTVWVGLPVDGDFRVQVETSGELKSEIALEPNTRAAGLKRATGSLGDGRQPLTIQSGSGAVELVRVR